MELPKKGDRHFVPKPLRKLMAKRAEAARKASVRLMVNENVLQIHAINQELEHLRSELCHVLGRHEPMPYPSVSVENTFLLIEDIYNLNVDLVRCWKEGALIEVEEAEETIN